ncbi:MAG: TetR/AcrR family transcriptional regulator [Parvibaculaceae bacterium]|jgi:AcrR family transcriptional regulator
MTARAASGRVRTETVRKARARLRRTDGARSEALLETALMLFSEEGYRDVTIQRIAERLHVRHSLIYYYFESKEKLFHSALLHALEKVIAEYHALKARHAHPVDLINDWFCINVDLAPLLKGLIKIMIDHASLDRRAAPKFVGDIVRDFYALEQTTLANCIREGVKKGLFKCDQPDAMAAFVSRNIDGIYYGAIVRRDASIPDSMEELRKNIWRLLGYEGRDRRKTEA